MAEQVQKTYTTANKMPYDERLAHYELEKMNITRTAVDSKIYEQALIALAKKWRI